MICLILTFPTAGCLRKTEPVPPPIEEALFCDLMLERFRYAQTEIDLRVVKFPANLRREFELNKHFDRECFLENTEEV